MNASLYINRPQTATITASPSRRGFPMQSNGTAAQVATEKKLYRIGEVSRLANLKPFVLRYWETEFPMLQPLKSPGGSRLYRQDDVDMVFLAVESTAAGRSEEHTSELQSPDHLVCRLLLEKKKKKTDLQQAEHHSSSLLLQNTIDKCDIHTSTVSLELSHTNTLYQRISTLTTLTGICRSTA